MATVTTDDGIKIDYEFDDFTNPWDDEAETIGLLHGSTLNKKLYAPMVPYLGRKFRVLRWDQRGRGASTAPPPGSTLSGAPVDDGVTVVQRYARDALCVMNHLGIKKIHWVGDSSGGITGANFALMFPERVHTLTCIQAPLVKIPADFEKAWAAGEKDPATAIEKYGMADYYERIGTTWVTDPKRGNERFQAWQKEERKKIATHSYIGHWKWQSLADLTDQLPGMKVPVQLLSSDRSGICPVEQQERIRNLIPDCELKIYSDYGHGIAFLEPERVAADVMDFIARKK